MVPFLSLSSTSILKVTPIVSEHRRNENWIEGAKLEPEVKHRCLREGGVEESRVRVWGLMTLPMVCGNEGDEASLKLATSCREASESTIELGPKINDLGRWLMFDGD
ncbi:hypothetical protein VNO77_18902 [Canavalia gladiata]|uniref:Uncharacterized protein n=1 Tax=Canavalia gladiata TaxID=3824 RepID=A0AAN9QK18_CANGL